MGAKITFLFFLKCEKGKGKSLFTLMGSHLLSEKANKTKLNQTLQQAGSEMQAPGAKTGLSCEGCLMGIAGRLSTIKCIMKMKRNLLC